MGIKGQGTLRAAIPTKGLDQVGHRVAVQVGSSIELHIKLKAPVDEGRLQNSISMRDDRGKVTVATQLNYAPFPKTVKGPGGNVPAGDYVNGLPPYWAQGVANAQKDVGAANRELGIAMRQYLFEKSV